MEDLAAIYLVCFIVGPIFGFIEINNNIYILDDKKHRRKLKDFIIWSLLPTISLSFALSFGWVLSALFYH